MHVLRRTILTTLWYKKVAEKLDQFGPIATPPTFLPGTYPFSWNIIFLRWLATRASRHHLPQKCSLIYWSTAIWKSSSHVYYFYSMQFWEGWGLNTASYLDMQNTHPVCHSTFQIGDGGGERSTISLGYLTLGLRGYEVRLIFVMKTYFGNHAHGI